MNPNQLSFFTNHRPEHVFDPLTRCVNRDYFFKFIDSLIEKNTIFSLYYVDIDNYKRLIKFNGSSNGDKVMIDIASLLSKAIDERGIIARMDDDQFGIVIPNIASYGDVWTIARTYHEAIRNYPFSYLKKTEARHPATVTSGIARFPIDGTNTKTLDELCGKALYRGKTKGKNCFIIYNKEMHSKIDVHTHNFEINLTGLIHYTFHSFETSPVLDALHKVAHMIGNYYSDASIFYFHNNKVSLIYNALEGNNDNEDPIFDTDFILPFSFTANEPYRILYLSLIRNQKEYESIANIMIKNHYQSIVIYQTMSPEKQPAYLFFNSELEKVWSERELGMYLLLANLFSLYNKNN